MKHWELWEGAGEHCFSQAESIASMKEWDEGLRKACLVYSFDEDSDYRAMVVYHNLEALRTRGTDRRFLPSRLQPGDVIFVFPVFDTRLKTVTVVGCVREEPRTTLTFYGSDGSVATVTFTKKGGYAFPRGWVKRW